MTLTHLLRAWTKDAATAATSLVRHPIGSAAMAVGLVKGSAEAGAGLVRDLVRGTPEGDVPTPGADLPTPGADLPTKRADLPTQRGKTTTPGTGGPVPLTRSGPRQPSVVPKPVPEIGELPEPVVIEADDDAEAGESFHHEPKVASREGEHGDGPFDREELTPELEEFELEEPELGGEEGTSVWTSETPAPGRGDDEPVLDEGIARAVRSESEMLRRAAEQQPE